MASRVSPSLSPVPLLRPPTPAGGKEEGGSPATSPGVAGVEQGNADDDAPGVRFKQSNSDLTISRYIRKLGSRARSILNPKTVGSNRRGDLDVVNSAREDEEEREGWTHRFLGDPKVQVGEVDEYRAFVDFYNNAGSEKVNETSLQEFKESLREVNLDSDDVVGMRDLAESAHITKTMKGGIYDGLDQNVSSFAVASIVCESWLNLTSAKVRDEEAIGMKECMRALKKGGGGEGGGEGGGSRGVKQQVIEGWGELKKSEQLHRIALEGGGGGKISTNTLEQYCQYFSAESIISDVGLKLADGGELETKTKTKPTIKDKFEQVNDDLYARRDNKFIVLNGAAKRHWTEHPKTNTHRINVERIFEK